MSKKRYIFELIDSNCVSPVAAQAIKDYINNLIVEANKANGRKKNMERV